MRKAILDLPDMEWPERDIGTYGEVKPDGTGFGPIWDWYMSHKPIVESLERKRTCLQAGGALGMYPILLSRIFDAVITFEPSQESYDYLVKNTKNYQNIFTYNLALGSTDGHAELVQRSKENVGMNEIRVSESGQIKITTLDSFNFNNVDLIWLDIEGYELEALKGAEKTIKKFKPVIGVERANYDIEQLLSSYGYFVSNKKSSHMDTFYFG